MVPPFSGAPRSASTRLWPSWRVWRKGGCRATGEVAPGSLEGRTASSRRSRPSRRTQWPGWLSIWWRQAGNRTRFLSDDAQTPSGPRKRFSPATCLQFIMNNIRYWYWQFKQNLTILMKMRVKLMCLWLCCCQNKRDSHFLKSSRNCSVFAIPQRYTYCSVKCRR